MRGKSYKGKKRNRMGKGDGKEYKSWIEVGEFGSKGTAARIVDYKTGRVVHLFSQLEAYVWYLIRWNDNVIDIKEQFPLSLTETKRIAQKYGIKHPSVKGDDVIMTSDFYVKSKKGDFIVSVKPNKHLSERTLEKLFIEKEYWKSNHKMWKIITSEDINVQFALNIRDVVTFYNEKEFPDEISLVKYLIAHKYIETDLKESFTWDDKCKQLKEEIEKWKILFYKSEIF